MNEQREDWDKRIGLPNNINLDADKMKIDRTTRLQIISQSLGQLLYIKDKPKTLEPILTSIDLRAEGLAICYSCAAGTVNSCWTTLENIALLKKPLGEISVKDAAEIWRIYTGNKFNNSLDVEVVNGQMLVREMFLEGESKYQHNSKRALRVYDELRSRGYALPYGTYSVEQLEKAGIYKLIK